MIINSGASALPSTVRRNAVPAEAQGQTGSLPPSSSSGGAIETVATAIMDTGFFTFNEIVEAGRNDPALALRYGATTLSEKLLEGVGQNVRDGFGQAIIPTIRLAVLGANGYRMAKTLKDPTAHIAEKGLDAMRVATDVVGLAGSVLKYAFPARAALGDTLVGVSYAADAVSHSVRLMTHGAERVTVWKKALAERREAGKKRPQVGPTVPAPVPTLVASSPLNAAKTGI